VHNDYPEPEIKTSRAAYTVWILPFVALLLALWLIYKNFTDAGIDVYLTLPDANGIIAKKTVVKFRGIEVGRVRDLRALEDGSGILARIEMSKNTEAYLTDKLKFWLVKPNVGFGGITGLDTLLSGAYIQVDGGEEVKQGNSTRYYKAQMGAPEISIPEEMLVYKLVSSQAAGVTNGSLIYHRNINVGRVRHVQLTDDHQAIEITIAISPEYEDLVKWESRFWSVSGLKASIDMSGIKLESSGFVPMLVGGVAVSSPSGSPAADEFTTFRLYANADAARDSLEVSLTFSGDADIKKGSSIYFKQQKVGKIDSLEWDDNFTTLKGKAKLSVELASLMRSETQFWLDKPTMQMEDFSVTKLIQGTVINVSPGSGTPTTSFKVLNESPYKKWSRAGLNLTLKTADAYGINKGTEIYYKSKVIGQIQWVDFDAQSRLFTLDALIFPQFNKMLNQGSLFYNVSGMSLDAKLTGIELNIPSFKQLVGGGIGVYLSQDKKAQSLVDKSSVKLYQNLSSALASQTNKTSEYLLRSDDLASLAAKTPIYYKAFKIGQVSDASLSADATHSVVKINIEPQFQSLVRQDSRFWIKSALDVKASVHGVQFNAGPLLSMIGGGIQMSVITPSSKKATNDQSFTLHKNAHASEQNSPLLTLMINKETTLRIGAAVKYRGYNVGEVQNVELMNDLSGIRALVKISPQYFAHFSREGTVFWLVQPQVGFRGIKNVATSVFGDYLSVDKGEGQSQREFIVNQSNLGYGNGFTIDLQAEQLGSLKVGAPILYKQLMIGEVSEVQLAPDNRHIVLRAAIYQQYSHLITHNSKFWNASGISMDFGLMSGLKIDSQTLESIVSGGIALAVPLEDTKVQHGHHFVLHAKAQSDWQDGLIDGSQMED
jgi:paraquat-inducible protein B